MPDIYDFLIVKKPGKAYRKDKIISSSLYNVAIDIHKKIRGNSRIWGDASEATQKEIIDKIISIGARFHLTYKDISYALLLCYAESGFNPDAAAGTTTASGLAQYTLDTMKDFSKIRSEKYLGQKVVMTRDNVFDADIGVYGVIVAYLFNKNLAEQWIERDTPKFWQTIYMLHHDGPGFYTDNRGRDRAVKGNWSQDAVNTYNIRILSKLDTLASLLTQSTVEVAVQLEDEEAQPIINKEYIIAVPKVNLFSKVPQTLSTNRTKEKKHYTIINGKTDANGLTKAIFSSIGCEFILLLCSNKTKKINKSIHYDEYFIKKGDTLSKIAQDNNLSIDEIINRNKIKNPNKIKSGDKLILKRKYLRHRPSKSAVIDILSKIGHNYIYESVIFSRNHIVKPNGSVSSSFDKKQANILTIRTPVAANILNKKTGNSPKREEHDTNKQGNSKNVLLEKQKTAVIYTFQDMNYAARDEKPKQGYTVFYDHLGNKLFSFTSGSRVDSRSKPGAADPMTVKFVRIEGGTRSSRLAREYGTTKIISDDPRGRWIHGGGPQDGAYEERQKWRVTKGCTRAQNIDLETLAQKIKEFKREYPTVEIIMIRDTEESSKEKYPR